MGLIFVLTCARVSPDLHAWLHAADGDFVSCSAPGHTHSHHEETDANDSGTSDRHFCGVLALQLSSCEFSFISSVYTPSFFEYVSVELGQSLWLGQFVRTAQARAPPIEVIV